MYRLTRVHLDSVGSKAARFANLTLDFTDDEHNPLDTIVWLRNGGGKTSLLALIFSLLLPNQRDFLGVRDDRSLGDYVLSGDTAHVLCEWDTPNGLLVTGAVYEWPERRRPPDHDKHLGEMVARYYAFSPKAGTLTFDERPVRDDGARRRNLDGYVRELRAIGRSHPMTGLVVASTKADWRQALLDRGIDPSVFRYQKEMNRAEGAIDEQFKFSTGEAFVNFLLDMAVDPDASESVSERMRAVAAKLARRPETERELTYCEGVAERLAPIAATWNDLSRHRSELEAAVEGAQTLASALHAAHTVAEQTETDAETARLDAAQRARDAERERTAARDRGREYARRAAIAWVDDANARAAALEAEKSHVEGTTSGWHALEDLFTLERLDRQVADIDRQLSELSHDAEPLRLARNEAARTLHWRYDAVSAQTRAATESALAQGSELEAEADEHARAATEAETAKGRLGAEITAARRTLTALDIDVEAAVTAGHLELGEAPDAGLARAEQTQADTAAALERLEAQITGATARQNELVAERTDLGAEITALRAARQHDDAERADLLARAEVLGAHARLRELAQSDEVSLWGASQMLDGRLAEEISRADGALIAEGVGAQRDRRNLAALGAGGLLPPSEDTAAIIELLDGAGITAVSGLAYLAQSVPRRSWDETIDGHPGLLSGVLVDAGSFDRACAVVIDAELHPASLVTIAKKSDLSGTGEAAFVVPPSPALYDTERADAERKVLDTRLSNLDRRIGLLEAGREADRTLRDELRALLLACPSGHLDLLAGRIAEHDQALATLTDRATALEAESDELSTLAAQASERRRELTATLVAVRERITVLAALSERSAGRDELTRTLETAESEHAAAVETAATSSAGAASARRRAAECEAQAAELRRELRDLAAKSDAVTLRGDDDWGPALQDSAGAGPTEALESELRRADEAYQGKITDAVLEDRRSRALEDRATASAALEERGAAARARATELRSEPAALDAVRRTEALDALRQRLESVLGEQGEVRADLAAAEARLREVTPPDRRSWRDLAEDGLELPAGRPDAEVAAAYHESEASRLQLLVSEAERDRDGALARRDAAKSRKELLAVLAASLENLVPAGFEANAPTALTAFSGSDDEARAATTETMAALKGAVGRFEESQRMLDSLVTALRSFAGRAEYEAAGSLREAIVTGEVSDVARRADELAEGHHTRAAVLRADLAAIAEDQAILVTDLADQVRRALDLFKKAPSTSVMDRSLGEWGGKSFLTIGFDDISGQPAELARRVSAEVDAIVAKGSVPEGLATLKRAVHAAVPGGFKVRVLKPTADLHEERVPVSAMAKWSGGEKLTAAVVLYCVIARLRARNRSRELLSDSSGALVLDNPLGKASFVGFLALQRRVASALGVQLLYTTAVRDLRAVGMFPNVIRCRNQRPVGSDRGFITASERAGDAHGTSLEGFVSSARVVRLDPPTAAVAGNEAAPADGFEGGVA